jgi:hypothetical protein
MATSAEGRWSPGIGDPTVMGWVTVVAYFTALVLCVLCAARESEGRQRRFWQIMAVLMLLLGINKQLDLQTWFTQTGRDLAMSQGWYGQRRIVQVAFISALALGGLVSQIWLYRALRDLGSEVRWAALGLVFLTVFVIIRATSFHHVDVLLHITLGEMRINWILELGGIGCIAAAAAARLKRA